MWKDGEDEMKMKIWSSAFLRVSAGKREGDGMVRTGVVPMAAMFVAMAALPASARQASPLPAGARVAYVSGQRLSAESAEGKAGTARIQALQQAKAADIRARQQAYEAVRMQLTRATDAGARTTLEKEEGQRRAELERAVAQAQADIQSLQRQITNDLMAKVRPILEQLVAGTDVQVVLQSDGPVLWAAPGLDLTLAVLERLNAGGAGGDK